jgi:hypothetical protein
VFVACDYPQGFLRRRHEEICISNLMKFKSRWRFVVDDLYFTSLEVGPSFMAVFFLLIFFTSFVSPVAFFMEKFS